MASDAGEVPRMENSRLSESHFPLAFTYSKGLAEAGPGVQKVFNTC